MRRGSCSRQFFSDSILIQELDEVDESKDRRNFVLCVDDI